MKLATGCVEFWLTFSIFSDSFFDFVVLHEIPCILHATGSLPEGIVAKGKTSSIHRPFHRYLTRMKGT